MLDTIDFYWQDIKYNTRCTRISKRSRSPSRSRSRHSRNKDKRRKIKKSENKSKSKKKKNYSSSESDSESSESSVSGDSDSQSESDSESESSSDDSDSEPESVVSGTGSSVSKRNLVSELSTKASKLSQSQKNIIKKVLKGLSKQKRIKLAKSYPLPRSKFFRSKRLDSFMKKLYKIENKRYNVKADKNRANQASRALDALGPLLLLQRENKEARSKGVSLTPERVDKLVTVAMKLVGNSYHISQFERRKAIMYSVIPDNVDLLEDHSFPPTGKHLFGKKFESKVLKNAQLHEKFTSMFAKKKSNYRGGSNSRQFFQSRPGPQNRGHRPGQQWGHHQNQQWNQRGNFRGRGRGHRQGWQQNQQ